MKKLDRAGRRWPRGGAHFGGHSTRCCGVDARPESGAGRVDAILPMNDGFNPGVDGVVGQAIALAALSGEFQ
ncbi:MAG: hypothetical protein M3Z74_10270 [Pseudomonadota bacterium]|nr:hypothetical protein [Pseudomonadota bacterium]